MSSPEFLKQNSKKGKFITIITGRDTTDKIIEEVRNKFGISRFTWNTARGLTVVDSRIIGKFFYVEKSIVTILTDDEIAEKVFEFLYNYLEVESKPGSFMYMGEVKNLTELRLTEQDKE